MIKVIADDKIPFLKGILESYCNIEYFPAKEITNKVIKDADALIVRTRTLCNENLLKGTNVKFIATATIGYDHIDTDYCEKNGIRWTNAPGCNSGSVMQYIASALAFLYLNCEIDLRKRTIGVIGVGNVGSKIVKLAEILGIRVLLNDPPLARKHGVCGFVSLDTLLKESDIITIHTPLNIEGEDKTYHLFDNTTFNKMNKGSIFINTSRGEVVDTFALLENILNRKISLSVIDVWENEPFCNTDLLNNVTIGTPHVAGYSQDGKANATIMSVDSLNSFFNLGINIKEIKLNLTKPIIDELEINCTNKKELKVICDAIMHTYNIKHDSDLLINNPVNFEKFRENYQIRREFNAFTLKLFKPNKSTVTKLKMLGFNVVEI